MEQMVNAFLTFRKHSVRIVLAVSAMLAAVLLLTACGAHEPTTGPKTQSEELYQAISVGSRFTCGLRLDGSIRCWGQNEANEEQGMLDAPKDGTFVAVASGYYGNCALRDDGRLKCWGRVDGGSKPFSKFSAVQMKDMDVCALRQDGRLKCWGRDLGNLSEVPDGMFLALSAGANYGCGIRTNGSLACWGEGASEEWATPPAGIFQSVSAADIGMCGLRPSGEIECWAPPGKGLLAYPSGAFMSISLGSSHGCGVRPDRRVECWGRDNEYGRASPRPCGSGQ